MASREPSPAPPVAALAGVHRSYREGAEQRAILAGADLTVTAGELVALLGRSGSGKSTLIHLLAGIDAPDQGRVEVLGTDLGALDETARTRFRARNIGLVFQFFHLLPTLTVLENVLLPLELAGDRSAAGRERALALLGRVGLEHRRDAFPDVLSGGEQQRIAVARALVTDPALVLADEPTGNLDQDSAGIVLELLQELAREGHTVLMATHSRAAAAA